MTLRMRILIKLIVVCLLVLPATAFPEGKGLTVKGVRHFSYASFTRIVIEIEAAAPYILTKAADGHSLLLTAYDGDLTLKSPLPAVQDGVVSGIESKEEANKLYISIRLDAAAGEVKDFTLRGPDRIVLDIAKGASSATVAQPGKLVVVVLDAGHGGNDTGVVTKQGQEKTIALEVAQAIKKILLKDPRLKPVMTREKDQALSLNERAIAANTAGATIFVSIHAAPGLNGRVYIQDLDEDAGGQAARPVSRDFFSFEAGSERQQTLWGRQQAAHTQESGALGRLLARQIDAHDGAGPLQAPLAELKSVDAAAVVIEVGTERDRAKVADAIAKGIEQYAGENR